MEKNRHYFNLWFSNSERFHIDDLAWTWTWTWTWTSIVAVAIADFKEKMMNQTNRLHHEKLDVYQISIQFLAHASSLIKKFPRGNGEMKDPLKRASISIVLIIAQGYGKTTNDEGSCKPITLYRSVGAGWALKGTSVFYVRPIMPGRP